MDQEDMKAKAMAYYQANKVPLHMQAVLNEMFHQDPPDVNGYVSQYFEALSVKPVITRVLAARSMDSKGQPAITTKVYCTLRNKEQLVGESALAIDTMLPDNAKQEDKEEEDRQRCLLVDEALRFINEEARDILCAKDPCNQQLIDEALSEVGVGTSSL